MAPGAPPRYLSAQRQRSHLPAEVTGFIGRRAELARIAALLDSARLITVTGPAGIGKTRVALRAAAHAVGNYRDGACLVELSGAAGSRSTSVPSWRAASGCRSLIPACR